MIVLDILSLICLVSGAIFSIIGGIGIVRLPDFYSRLHGGGITDTMGAGLIILGLLFQVGHSASLTGGLLVAFKLVTIFSFLFITSPSSCHALAKSAYFNGLPVHEDTDPAQEPAGTDP